MFFGIALITRYPNRNDYFLTHNQVYIETKSSDAKDTLSKYTDFVRTLTSAESVEYSSDIPSGCIVTVVNDDVNAHVLLKVILFMFIVCKQVERRVFNTIGQILSFRGLSTLRKKRRKWKNRRINLRQN